MSNENIFAPIRNFAYFLSAIGVCGIIIHLLNVSDPYYASDFRLFVLMSTFVHLGIGFGLLARVKSAFHAFKFYLYFLKIGFPVGTYISKKTLDYIQKNNIEQFLV